MNDAKLECYICDIQTGLLTWTEGYGGVYLCEPCKVKTDNECAYCGETGDLEECRECDAVLCAHCRDKGKDDEDGFPQYYCEQCWEDIVIEPSTTPPYNPFDDDKLWDDAVYKWAGVQNDDNKRKAIETAARIQSLLRNEHSQDALETACRALATIEGVMNKE